MSLLLCLDTSDEVTHSAFGQLDPWEVSKSFFMQHFSIGCTSVLQNMFPVMPNFVDVVTCHPILEHKIVGICHAGQVPSLSGFESKKTQLDWTISKGLFFPVVLWFCDPFRRKQTPQMKESTIGIEMKSSHPGL